MLSMEDLFTRASGIPSLSEGLGGRDALHDVAPQGGTTSITAAAATGVKAKRSRINAPRSSDAAAISIQVCPGSCCKSLWLMENSGTLPPQQTTTLGCNINKRNELAMGCSATYRRRRGTDVFNLAASKIKTKNMYFLGTFAKLSY